MEMTRNAVSWFEIPTADFGRAKAFYSTIFDFEMPRDLVEGFGYPEFSDEIKRGIMGENFLRLHGVDTAGLRAKIADDDVARYRAANGLETPWGKLREQLATA